MRNILVISLLVAAVPASAQVQPAPGRAVTPTANGGDRVICRSVEEIGSRLSAKRVCMTSAQWAEQRRLQAAEVEEMQRRGQSAGSK